MCCSGYSPVSRQRKFSVSISRPGQAATKPGDPEGHGGHWRWQHRPKKVRSVLPSPSKTLARGVERRVFTAWYRRVTSTETKILQVPALLIRQRLRIECPVRLIIRSAKVRLIVDSVMVRLGQARILSKHRCGDCGGKDKNGTENFEFDHCGLRLSWGSPPFDVSLTNYGRKDVLFRSHHLTILLETSTRRDFA